MNIPAIQLHLSDTALGQAAHTMGARSGSIATFNEGCASDVPSTVGHLGLQEPAVSEPYYRMAIPV